MRRSLYFEIHYTLLRAFQTLVPPPRDREPVIWQNALHRHAYLIPLYFLAYLARRKDTYYMRLLMLPTALVLVIRGTFAYSDPDPQAYYETWLRGIVCILVIAKSLDYAFARDGRFKDGETALPSLHDGAVNGVYKPANNFLPSALADANDLVCSLRGIGWDFGRGVYIAPEWRSLQRSRFLLESLISGIKNFLLFDFCLYIFIQLPGIGSTDGGSLFFHNLPLVQRYIVSTIITLLVGVFFVAGFEVWNSLGSLIGVGIFQQDPKQWPPIINNPWAADSLHDFWARRWHQGLRRTFFVLGGILGQWIAGKAGMIIGTFFGSAFLHEGGLYIIDRGFDYRAPLFFFLQAVGVIVEWWFYKATGRKVAGFVGRVWTWIFVLGFGQILIDAWFTRGLAGSRIIPFEISPTRLWLIPAVRPWLAPTLRPVLERSLL